MDRPGASRALPKPAARVLTERESVGGWRYEVLILWPDGAETAHDVTLGWRDHDYWCGGASAPSRVVQSVVEYVLDHWDGEIPPRFDAARVRRWLPRIDEELRGTI
ncbi:MAG: hypothetical protein SFY69_11875 [Planctomycetota bacterium]|nr:hypothetical protein [Planctomycetota bacterium]